jgi:inhibitor of cysteine peptidase
LAELAVTTAQDGRVLPVRVGDSISVQLPENPTTGYSWAFATVDDMLLEVGSPTYRGESPGVGGGGVKTWTLKARAPGKTRVELKRWRPWEGDQSVVERFTVTLDIKPR